MLIVTLLLAQLLAFFFELAKLAFLLLTLSLFIPLRESLLIATTQPLMFSNLKLTLVFHISAIILSKPFKQLLVLALDICSHKFVLSKLL